MALLSSLPDRQLLDRIVRGRAWIPLLGLLLAGIVALQVEVLKLGASIGRSVQRSSALATTNQVLQANVASLADDQRIERLAAAMGMTMPAPDAIGFLKAHGAADAGQAIANIQPPNPSGFLTLLYSNGAVVGFGDGLGSTTAQSGASAASSTAPSPGLVTPLSSQQTVTPQAPSGLSTSGQSGAVAVPSTSGQSGAVVVPSTSGQSGANAGG